MFPGPGMHRIVEAELKGSWLSSDPVVKHFLPLVTRGETVFISFDHVVEIQLEAIS